MQIMPKKFIVPDNAITWGRLVQCSSGNKWTQYPIIQNIVEEVNYQTKKNNKKPKRVALKQNEVKIFNGISIKKEEGEKDGAVNLF